MFKILNSSTLVCFITVAFKLTSPVKCQKTNRTHCDAVGQKIATGTHYLDPKTCTIYHCRESHIRHAKIDLYYCRGIDQVLFDDLYEDCLEHKCDTGEFIHSQTEKTEKYKKKSRKHKKKKNRFFPS